MTFDDTKEYVKAVKKVDGHKFNNVTEITNMIDFLNEENEKKKKDYGDNEIHEITKFLTRYMTNKTFHIKVK